MKSVNTDVAYEHIRKKILNGEYLPGRPLMTEVLAEEIGVSRTPVRDALRKLETDGLVSIQPHLGASVKKIQLKEFRELCDLRLALESHAAGLAARNRSDADLHEIRFALEAMRRLTEKSLQAGEEYQYPEELAREDARFHIAIMTGADNDLMKKEILRLHVIHRVLALPALPGQAAMSKAEWDARRVAVFAKHEEIYEAIADSDPIAAKREMEFHLQEMIDNHMLLVSRSENVSLARELTAEELVYSS
ncbi:MAG: GntR family transcriptional regulator [Verrucomicrobia bacterium]|nr:GntR family transcriptional regulator [Verrucomicrobiota bacterium]